jgi:hypothetical protein
MRHALALGAAWLLVAIGGPRRASAPGRRFVASSRLRRGQSGLLLN